MGSCFELDVPGKEGWQIAQAWQRERVRTCSRRPPRSASSASALLASSSVRACSAPT